MQQFVGVQRLAHAARVVPGVKVVERQHGLLQVLAGFQTRIQLSEPDHHAPIVAHVTARAACGLEHVVAARVVQRVFLNDVRVFCARVSRLVGVLPAILKNQGAGLWMNNRLKGELERWTLVYLPRPRVELPRSVLRALAALLLTDDETEVAARTGQVLCHGCGYVEADGTVGSGSQGSAVQSDRVGILSVQRPVPVRIFPTSCPERLRPGDLTSAGELAVEAGLGALTPIVQQLVDVQRFRHATRVVAAVKVVQRQDGLLEGLAGLQARIHVRELDDDAAIVARVGARGAGCLQNVVAAGVVQRVLLDDVGLLRARVDRVVGILAAVLEDECALLRTDKQLVVVQITRPPRQRHIQRVVRQGNVQLLAGLLVDPDEGFDCIVELNHELQAGIGRARVFGVIQIREHEVLEALVVGEETDQAVLVRVCVAARRVVHVHVLDVRIVPGARCPVRQF